MAEAGNDVFASMTFPMVNGTRIYSTNPLERLNAEIKGWTRVEGTFRNEAAIVGLVSNMLARAKRSSV